MIPAATVWGKCSNIFGTLTVWAVQKQLMPCLALLKTRRLFYLQAIASSVHKKGWGVRWAEPALYRSDPTQQCLRRWEFSVKRSGKRKRSVAVVRIKNQAASEPQTCTDCDQWTLPFWSKLQLAAVFISPHGKNRYSEKNQFVQNE